MDNITIVPAFDTRVNSVYSSACSTILHVRFDNHHVLFDEGNIQAWNAAECERPGPKLALCTQ